MELCFATCLTRPRITDDDAILARALDDLGVQVHARPWQEIEPSPGAATTLLRSTWDYYRHPREFHRWLCRMGEARARLLNPAATALGNMDKWYLRELEHCGFPLPRTRWLDRPERTSVARILEEERWERAVLKPRVSAGSHGTILIEDVACLSNEALIPAQEAGGLVQEFLPEIQDEGELSLMFFGGEFSHAIRKQPRPGDFRVQSKHGGDTGVATPSPGTLALGHSLVATIPPPCPYARVDIVETRRGPLLMELELIEPELFFRHAPDSASRLAWVIHRHLAED